MSVGTSTCTVNVKRGMRELDFVGNNWFRQLLNLTVTNASQTAANMTLFAWYGDTLVATGSAFTGSTSSATGTMDTNTTELEAICKDIDGDVNIKFLLWDASVGSLELIGRGNIRLMCSGVDYGTSSSPVSPITGSTVKIGIFAFYNGLTYGLNSADSLYYRLTFDGAGETIHWHFEEAGISIP